MKVTAGHVRPKMPKINKPSLNNIKTRVCLGKTIIMSIVSTEHIAYTPAVSLAMTSAYDIMKHKSMVAYFCHEIAR